MTNFGITTTRVGNVVDTRWRAFAHGEDTARPGQIATADFAAYAGLVNPGYIPSGVAVTRTSAGEIKPFLGETADPGNALYGFISDDEGVPAEGDYQTVAILRHGGINPNYLPVADQRPLVTAEATAQFIITEV